MSREQPRTLWLDYLRTTLTVLVVAHHASLAYTTFAQFRPEAYILSTHPVVDKQRWIGTDIFENFNDVFFMSLMFFISGLFVQPALQKKGTRQFLRDRFNRLFVPFVIAVSLLMLIAYYPAYLLAYDKPDLRHYIIDFFTTEQWPVGPPWFIWLLFAFNLIIALLYPWLKNWLQSIGHFLDGMKNKPARLYGCWYIVTWALLVPLAHSVGPGTWTGWGPLDFQLSRILLYFGYFLMGVAAHGASGEEGLLARNITFSRSWPLQAALCLAAYTLLTLLAPRLATGVAQGVITANTGWMIYYLLFVGSCTSSCLAFLSAYNALVHQPRPWLQSLTANAYGIYLVHYMFITWSQYLLLQAALPAPVKWLLSFSISLLLSWGLVALLRQHKKIKQYL